MKRFMDFISKKTIVRWQRLKRIETLVCLASSRLSKMVFLWYSCRVFSGVIAKRVLVAIVNLSAKYQRHYNGERENGDVDDADDGKEQSIDGALAAIGKRDSSEAAPLKREFQFEPHCAEPTDH